MKFNNQTVIKLTMKFTTPEKKIKDVVMPKAPKKIVRSEHVHRNDVTITKVKRCLFN